MPKPATEAPAPIRLTTNCIFNGRFFARGEVLPVESVDQLTETLQPLVVTSEPEAEEENKPIGAFQLNTPYQLTSDGRLGRKLQREIQQMEDDEARDEWIEDQLDAELPPEIVQDLQAQHESAIAFAKAQAEADARRSDAASDFAAAAMDRPSFLCGAAQGTMHRPTRRG